jgi:class 3 adenylate cyclase
VPRFRSLSNISLATRLSLVALLVTLVSLAITAAVGLKRGSDLADGVADDRLVTVSASRTSEIEIELGAVAQEIEALADSPAAAHAIESLGDALIDLSSAPVQGEQVDRLTEFYLADVVPELERVRGTQVGASFLVPDSARAIHLQSAYTVPKVDDDGVSIDPDLVLDPGDGSSYSELHPEVHQTYGQIALASGFDDLFLVDGRDDTIVYSMRKRIEFATSLDLGPHSGSALARLIDSLSDDFTSDARFTDFSSYVPARERPTVFVGSAVIRDGARIGYLVASLDVAAFDAIVSGNGEWKGFGDTGEAFLVGDDGVMRTTTRTYEEDPAGFLTDATEPGPAQLTDAQRRRIAETATTSMVQPVDRRLTGPEADAPGTVDVLSYRGEEVRAAYRRVSVPGVEWTLVVEVDRSELDDPVEDYARDMLLTIALFIVAVTFVAVRWSDRLVAPIRAIAARLRSVRTAGVADPGEVVRRRRGPLEYEELADNVDQMLDRLRDRQSMVEARSAERTSLLRQFLPAAIARRSEEGDGEVLDHARNASVVVLTVDGVGGLVGDRPDQEVRDLLADLVDEVDAIAAASGLERIKLVGSTYYAVCGVSRPFLDHAVRAVGFALASRDIVADSMPDGLRLCGGVAAGPVSVGLAARSALVYDVWGDAVSAAETLARNAPAGTIAVAANVRSQLPTDFVLTDDPDSGVSIVTAAPSRKEPVS